RGPVVDLHVEPEHPKVGAPVAQRIHRVDHLLPSRGTARGMAREEVSIYVAESSGTGLAHPPSPAILTLEL
ncbi:hypothetical protein PENTCL1PPCAC_634, partial [Pristionchus entomophagus]